MCNLCTTFSIHLYVSFAFLCFLFCFSFFLWVGSFSPSPLTSRGPSQCLNPGPGSEPWVNRGLGSLFWGYASDLSYFFLFFRCVLGLSPFIRLKATLCPGQYLCWGHSVLHREPSLCWPLASSGPSGILTWFSRPRPLAFLRPKPLQGWQYSWQVLRLAEPDLELVVWGGGPFGNYMGRGSRRINISSDLSGEISKEKLTNLTSLHLLSSTMLLLARGFPSS